eukprot:403342701
MNSQLKSYQSHTRNSLVQDPKILQVLFKKHRQQKLFQEKVNQKLINIQDEEFQSKTDVKTNNYSESSKTPDIFSNKNSPDKKISAYLNTINEQKAFNCVLATPSKPNHWEKYVQQKKTMNLNDALISKNDIQSSTKKRLFKLLGLKSKTKSYEDIQSIQISPEIGDKLNPDSSQHPKQTLMFKKHVHQTLPLNPNPNKFSNTPQNNIRKISLTIESVDADGNNYQSHDNQRKESLVIHGKNSLNISIESRKSSLDTLKQLSEENLMEDSLISISDQQENNYYQKDVDRLQQTSSRFQSENKNLSNRLTVDHEDYTKRKVTYKIALKETQFSDTYYTFKRKFLINKIHQVKSQRTNGQVPYLNENMREAVQTFKMQMLLINTVISLVKDQDRFRN